MLEIAKVELCRFFHKITFNWKSQSPQAWRKFNSPSARELFKDKNASFRLLCG